jgi:hypothetical protein
MITNTTNTLQLIAMMLMSGCVCAPKASHFAQVCSERCEAASLTVAYVSLSGATGSDACVCAPKPPQCEPAWNRAETCLALLGDCRAALLACHPPR